MKDYRVGLRYAQALLALAETQGELDRIEKELAEVGELLQRYPEISRLLLNTTLSQEEKEDFLEKVLPEGLSSLVINFLKVLIKKKRFEDFSLIQEKFHHLYEERKGLQKVRVETPIPLNETVLEKLQSVLEKKVARKVYLETIVNPEILGGLVLDFDGTQIDGSFRTALHELKQKLLAPSYA